MRYIEPNLKFFPTLNELLEPKKFFNSNISFSDLAEKGNILLVGEAGNGKTRLLKEYLLKNNIPGLFLDLKKIGAENIEEYIIRQSPNFEILKEKEYTKVVAERKEFITNGFELNENIQSIFCFDALDEVKSENFSGVIDSIKNLIRKYGKSFFLISCRKNYLNKWRGIFEEIDCSYVQIDPLDNQKIIKFLAFFKIDKNQIDTLMREVQLLTIIQTPRYLEMLGLLAEENNIEYLKKISKNELFEHFIYQKLNLESKKINSLDQKEIIKNILEKLALIMEIYQSTQITKDELMVFFDDIHSNLATSFLNQVTLPSLYERTVLRDNIDSIEFENKEFQEYLAAKEILRLGRVDQIVFELAVVPGIEEIHPSWITTLGFVVDQDIKVLKQILEYVFFKKSRTYIEDYMQLLTTHNTRKLSPEEKMSIFKMIYPSCHTSWIGDRTAEKLSFCYYESLYESLKKDMSNKRFAGDTQERIKFNNIKIIAFLIERNELPKKEREEFKIYVKELLNVERQSEAIIRASLFALGQFKDVKLFDEQLIDKIFQIGESNQIAILVKSLKDIDPNLPLSCKVFLRGLKANNHSARSALYDIENSESIKNILRLFIEDKDLLYAFIRHESLFRDEETKLVENIDRVADLEIIEQLKKLMLKAFDRTLLDKAIKSNFIKKTLFIINKYSPNYILQLIQSCKKDELFSYNSIFSILLKKKDIKEFILAINKSEIGSSRIAFQILESIKSSQTDDGEEIYQSGRKYLEYEYQKAEKVEAKLEAKRKAENFKKYNYFKGKLQPGKKDNETLDVFKFYIDNKAQLADFITDKDKNTLEKLMKEAVFEKFDPRAEMAFSDSEDIFKKYTIREWFSVFDSCISVVKEFELDISENRQKIINYIPFADDHHYETIIRLIAKPNPVELDNILNIVTNMNNDLEQFIYPSSIIKFIKNYKVPNGLAILKRFTDLNTLSIEERKSALHTISELNILNEDYFIEIFDKYRLGNEKEKELAENANAILIKNFKNMKAIEWRFQELIGRALPFEYPKGIHHYGRLEKELDKKEFAQPLIQLNDIEYEGKFLDLFKGSLEVIHRGKLFRPYGIYIGQVAISYFKKFKELRHYEILNDLKNFMMKNHQKEGVNLFKCLYEDLKQECMVFIEKHQNISDCIKKYNSFKEITYLSIAKPEDLYDLICCIIQRDIVKWIEPEGASSMFEKYQPEKNKKFEREDLIQKTIKTQFENGLLKAGLRANQIHILREAQLLNGKRPDFLIYYGLIGPIVIELKLANNDEITNKKKRESYKEKFIEYIKGTGSYFGILIIFQTEKTKTIEKYLPLLEQLYESEKNIKIKGLNCINKSNEK